MNIDLKKLPGNLYQNINLLNIILALTVISVAFIIYYYNTRDIQLKIAYRGWGPQDYVNQKLFPQNFKKNWDSGIMAYDYSIPMRIYYYLAKYFGISPSTTIYPFMFIQTLLFLSSVAFLTQTLFQNRFVTILAVFIIPLSNLAGLNLSRFGNGFGSYNSFALFYAYSNAFRIFALGFFLKNRYVLMFVFLALSVYCHVNMGLLGLVFIGGYLIYKPIHFRDKNLLLGMVVFLALVIPHIIFIIFTSEISSGGISVDQWVKSTRLFSYHWYPITMKLFTANAQRVFFPIILMLIFLFVAFRYQDIKDEKNQKVILGFGACMILSILGIIFSDIYPIPFLIRISLQRSTGLITFLGVLYIIYYLFKKCENGNVLILFLALYSLLTLVYSNPGISILPLFLLLYSDIKEGKFGPYNIHSEKLSVVIRLYFTASVLLLLLTLTCIFKNDLKLLNKIFVNLWTPLQFFNPFHGFDFLIWGGGFKVYPFLKYLFACFSLLALLLFLERKFRGYKAASAFFISLLILISFSFVWHLERNDYLRWHKRYASKASSYLDVQLWAKNNTPNDALFMPDPTHYYGFRDFSERSDFGNHREWGYHSIAYNPAQKVFNEGLKRMKALGLDISKISMDNIKNSESFPYSPEFHKNVQSYYYNMNADELDGIFKKFGIDYFIFNRNLRQKSLSKLFKKFKIVYSNDDFFVFIKGEQKADFESTFSGWKGKDKIFMHELTEKAAPLVLQGFRGDFNFKRISKSDGDVIRVSAIEKNDKKENLVVQFGYSLNEHGFDININPEQEVIFILFARLSSSTANATELFIQDNTENWDRKSVIINKMSWEEYVVTKRVRDGLSKLSLGIVWQPQSYEQWLEIKNVSVIVLNQE
jgi:hypothetical protein